MEKTYFCSYYESFEFRTRRGDRWTVDEIRAEYLSSSVFNPICVGKFSTHEEALNALLDDFGNPMYCGTREERGSNTWLLIGTLSYIAEEVWTVEEDGEEEYDQDNGWHELFIEPFAGDEERA